AVRAHLLARGLWARGDAKPVLLLDPASGFVLDADTRGEWETTALKAVLGRRYPPDVAQAALQPGDSGWAAVGDTMGRNGVLQRVWLRDSADVVDLSAQMLLLGR